MVIAKVRERLAVGKQAAQRFDRQRFNLTKLNEPEVREQYQIEITNMFAALENANDDEDLNRTCENIKENMQFPAEESLGLHELKQNKSWFDEECLGFLEQRKRAKLPWIQGPSQSNVDILNNVRREVSRRFKDKIKAYMRAKIEEIETNSKIKNIRDLYGGINYIKKGYQPRCNIVKDEKGDSVADSHSIVARWRNYFSQPFNVHGVKDVRQAEIHTAEPLVLEPSAAEFELTIDKLKSHKWPGIDQIPTELIKAGGRTICLEIHKLITSIWKREKKLEEWKKSIIIPIHKKGDNTDSNNYRGKSLLPTTYKIISTSCCQGQIHMRRKLSGIISVASDATGRLLIIYSAFVNYVSKNGNTMNQFISYL